MYRAQSRFHGRTLALLAAGPAFVAGLFSVGPLLRLEPIPIELGAGTALGALSGTAIVIPFGAMLALVPVIVGRELMVLAGAWNFGLRHPALWGMAGGISAFGLARLFGWDGRNPEPVALALIATGIVCALLCRLGAHWPQDDPAL